MKRIILLISNIQLMLEMLCSLYKTGKWWCDCMVYTGVWLHGARGRCTRQEDGTNSSWKARPQLHDGQPINEAGQMRSSRSLNLIIYTDSSRDSSRDDCWPITASRAVHVLAINQHITYYSLNIRHFHTVALKRSFIHLQYSFPYGIVTLTPLTTLFRLDVNLV